MTRLSSSGRTGWLASTPVAVVLFILATCWFTAPQIVQMDHVVPHQDPMFSTWRLAWVAHQLPRAPQRLLDTNILYPLRNTGVMSDPAPLIGLMGAPLLWLGAPAVVAYNVMLLASFVAAALGAFLLVRALTGSAAAGLVAGLIFGFSPFRFEHYMHLEIVWSAWIPLTLWAIHRTIATGRWAFGILTGLCIAAQVFSCVYLAVFLGAWLAVIGIMLIATGTLDLRSQAFRALVVGAIVGGAIVAPYGRAFMASSRVVGERSSEETTSYSAELDDYLASPSFNRLYGWTWEKYGANEKQLFPGVMAVLLAIVGLWPITRLRIVYLVALLFAFDLSLGFHGLTYPTIREYVPFFRGLRVMARAATMVQLALAVLAGYGVARLLTWGQSRATETEAAPGSDAPGTSAAASVSAHATRPAWIGAAIVVLASTVIVAEYSNQPLQLVQLPTEPPPLSRWLASQKDLVLMELPAPRMDRLPGDDPRYQFMSTFHWQRLVNGYSAFVPPRYANLMEILVWFPDERSIGALRTRGVTHVIVHPQLYPTSVAGRTLVERVAVSPDFAFEGWFPDGVGTAAVFRLLPIRR